MIDPEKYSKSKPVIKPADLDGATVAVVTIAEMEEIEIEDEPKIVLRFEEFPDHNYFPNVTSIRHLVDGLTANEEKWAGKQIVLETVKVNNPQTKKQQEALWVADPGTWGDHIRGVAKARKGGAARKGASATKKTTRARR